MLKNLSILFVVLLSFNQQRLLASHIVGGELSYKCLGNNQYTITLKMYRDCINGVAAFDQPAYLSIYSANGILQNSISMYNPTVTTIPPIVSSPCFTAPTSVCVEEGIYRYDTYLQSGSTIVYQRCCRNSTILNLSNPGDIGSTYYISIPSTLQCNTSPSFTQLPPMFLCTGVPFQFDYSAIEPDGDSLVYELCDPSDGASKASPAPTIASAPPYNPIIWEAGFNSTYPITSSPVFKINSKTGLLTGTPTQQGQFVVMVCVNEYRNGKLISTAKRDYQFNVIACPNYTQATVESQFELNSGNYCKGLSYTFKNKSTGGKAYHWDFGVTGTLSDTSDWLQPTFTYPDTGKYDIQLIVNPGLCADTTTETFHIYKLLDPIINAPSSSQCFSGNTWNLNVGGTYEPYATFNWDFGTGASPPFSSNTTINGLKFAVPDSHIVRLIVNQNICTDTIIDTLIVYPDAIAKIQSQLTPCDGFTANFNHSSQNASSYHWDFGETAILNDTSNLPNPIYIYSDTGIYNVSLIISTGESCADTDKVNWSIFPIINSEIQVNDTIGCVTTNEFDFLATGVFSSTATFDWNFGPNANVSSSNTINQTSLIFNKKGIQSVFLEVSDNGCTERDSIIIDVYTPPIIEFTGNPITSCAPSSVSFSNTSYGSFPLHYLWDFGDSYTDTVSNPSHVYRDAELYTVSLKAYSLLGCLDTSEIEKVNYITVYPTPQANIFIEPVEAPIFEPTITFINKSLNFQSCTLLTGDGNLLNECEKYQHTYSSTGEYRTMLTVENSDGCTNSVSKLIRILPDIRFYIPNTFTVNDDGINDIFLPKMKGITDFKMYVFDRWGDLIFMSEDQTTGWNGKIGYSGKIASEGVYQYKIEIIDIMHNTRYYDGRITLLR